MLLIAQTLSFCELTEILDIYVDEWINSITASYWIRAESRIWLDELTFSMNERGVNADLENYQIR